MAVCTAVPRAIAGELLVSGWSWSHLKARGDFMSFFSFEALRPGSCRYWSKGMPGVMPAMLGRFMRAAPWG